MRLAREHDLWTGRPVAWKLEGGMSSATRRRLLFDAVGTARYRASETLHVVRPEHLGMTPEGRRHQREGMAPTAERITHMTSWVFGVPLAKWVNLTTDEKNAIEADWRENYRRMETKYIGPVPDYVHKAADLWQSGGFISLTSDGGAIVSHFKNDTVIKLTADDRAALNRVLSTRIGTPIDVRGRDIAVTGMQAPKQTYAEMADEVWRTKTADISEIAGIKDIHAVRKLYGLEEKMSDLFGDPMGWERVRLEDKVNTPERLEDKVNTPEFRLRVPKYMQPEAEAPAARPLYVAVITRGFSLRGSVIPSAGRPSTSSGGDWASFIGYDKDDVIRQALEAANKYGKTSAFGAQYEVLVGTLTDKAQSKQEFTLKPIEPDMNLSLPAKRHVKSLVNSGQRIDAIRYVRNLTGCDLLTAKRYVDNLNLAPERIERGRL